MIIPSGKLIKQLNESGVRINWVLRVVACITIYSVSSGLVVYVCMYNVFTFFTSYAAAFLYFRNEI